MATGAGSLQEAGPQQWGERQQRMKSVSSLFCPLTQWDRELFPPCLPKSLLVNGAIFLSVHIHAKNIVKCMRGGQVIWAAPPTRFLRMSLPGMKAGSWLSLQDWICFSTALWNPSGQRLLNATCLGGNLKELMVRLHYKFKQETCIKYLEGKYEYFVFFWAAWILQRNAVSKLRQTQQFSWNNTSSPFKHPQMYWLAHILKFFHRFVIKNLHISLPFTIWKSSKNFLWAFVDFRISFPSPPLPYFLIQFSQIVTSNPSEACSLFILPQCWDFPPAQLAGVFRNNNISGGRSWRLNGVFCPGLYEARLIMHCRTQFKALN